MTLNDLQNKKILILGFGKEGRSTLAFLHRVFPNARIGTADRLDGPLYLTCQKEYDVAIRTPGIPKTLLTIPSTTATNLFFECVRGITIGVTGTKGKSTTASLIHAMLKAGGLKSHLVGNIGNPMLSELLLSNENDDVFVIELSSFQLDDINFSPHIAVYLNIFPDHLDYHGGFEKYSEAKANITRHSSFSDLFIYNPKYDAIAKIADMFPGISIPFVGDVPEFGNNTPLLGEHNRDNIRAAVTAAELMGVSADAIQTALSQFKPLPHRLQCVGKQKGILFYDDAISTTPESTIAAIETLSPIGTIFLGGADRGYDFTALADILARRKIPNLVLFPDTRETIKKAVSAAVAAGAMPRIMETKSMRDAVQFAYAVTPPGSICLLSCASPSFSVWRDFEEKGNEFQGWVRELGEKCKM